MKKETTLETSEKLDLKIEKPKVNFELMILIRAYFRSKSISSNVGKEILNYTQNEWWLP